MNGRKFYIRFLFRVCEVSSRILIFSLIWNVLNIYVFIGLVAIHLIHNLVLFFGGCLGREMFNIITFIFYIPRLNKTLQQGEIKSLFLSKNYYIKFYRQSSFEQTRMLMVRTCELCIYHILIVVYLYFYKQNALSKYQYRQKHIYS